MNKSYRYYSCFLLTILSILFFRCTSIQTEQRVRLKLKSTPFQFTVEKALTKLTADTPTGTFKFPHDSSSFSVHLKLKPNVRKDTTYLLKVNEVLDLKYYLHNQDREHQNYPSYTMADGSIPVFEADLTLHRSTHNARKIRLGIPVASLPEPDTDHEIVLLFTGVKWTMYVDNELVDNDFPIGYPKWGETSTWTIDGSVVSEAFICAPSATPKTVALEQPRIVNEIQYWTPHWHNSWVGDVVTFYFKGRYHLFYLFDRRGHTGKLGGGGHYFEHISTADFKTWEEHDAAIPLESQWETLGTGTPFIYDGRMALSYGLHTTRFFPKDQTALPLMEAFYKKHGFTGAFRYDTLSVLPAGATYAVSDEDGFNFKKSKVLYHYSENPSVYIDPQQRLRMLANYGAKGTWESNTLEGGWHPISKDFPPGGDCTFFFHWGKYDYIIGGFSGFWSKLSEAPDNAFEDQVVKGLDFYNGMNVPTVTAIPNGRYLIAAWIPMLHWGGTLNIHEMIQYEDGRIGTKWMEEIIPATKDPRELSKAVQEVVHTDESSFLLTFEVEPTTASDAKVGVVFLGEHGEENACEVQISSGTKRAQYAAGSLTAYAPSEKSIREGGEPHLVRNYAVENVMGINQPFVVRMIVKHDNKYAGSQIDTEIAGQRTMLSYRRDLKTSKVRIKEDGVTVKNIKIAALKK